MGKDCNSLQKKDPRFYRKQGFIYLKLKNITNY